MTQIPITRPVRLDVQVTVLHSDKSPAAGVPLRLVLGTAGDWQAASAGITLVTADDGTVQHTQPVVLEARRRKLPSNFFANLLASPETTRQVQVGVELQWAGRPWLATINVDRFADGTSSRLDPMRVFGRATDGRFTDDVPLTNGTWHKRLPNGKLTALPGFGITALTLDPETAASDNAAWRLQMTVTQWPVVEARD